MNKKDVLGLLPAAGNVQKMESTPHGLSAGNAQNTTLNHDKQGMVLAVLLLSDKVSTGADNS